MKYTHGQGMTVSVPFVVKLSCSVRECLTPSLFSFGFSYLSVGFGLNKKCSNRITQLYNITMIHAILLGGQNALAWKPSSDMLCHNGLCVWQLGCVTGFANTCPGLAPALYTFPAGCNGSDMYYILYRHTQLAARLFPLCTKIIW